MKKKQYAQVLFTGESQSMSFYMEEAKLRLLENCVINGNPFMATGEDESVFIATSKVDVIKFIYSEPKKGLDYNDIFNFLEHFGQGYLKHTGELILDYTTNVYTSTRGCESLEDLEARVVNAMVRPIGKGSDYRDANRLLQVFNKYFRTTLTRGDMRQMYQELTTLEDYKDFILKKFPVGELYQRDYN